MTHKTYVNVLMLMFLLLLLEDLIDLQINPGIIQFPVVVQSWQLQMF